MAANVRQTARSRRLGLRILHLDIETAPNRVYVWGLWNQNVSINQIIEPGYTLCWAAKWHGEKGVQFDSIHNSSPKKMIERVWKLLDEADAVCHYNGTKFDIPTLNQEFLLHGFPPPTPYKEIDLLRTARARFRFPSNKLDFVAQQLGLGSKLQHKGMELWRECMDGLDSAWRIMERYNKQDVRLLEKVYNALLPWIKNHPNQGIYAGRGNVCPNCGSDKIKKNGVEHTKTLTYQRWKCTDCGGNMRDRTRLERAPEGLKV